MNRANKLTMTRIVLAILILVILMIPYKDMGISVPTFLVMGKVLVDVSYIVAGFLFVIASVTDYLDGMYARKEKKTSDFGAILDAIADKVLVNGVLILLAYNGFISIIIPVIIVIRDILMDSLRILGAKQGIVVKANKLGKLKTVFMLIGISFMLFYNLPFEAWGIYVADIFVDIATVLSVVSLVSYYMNLKGKIKFV
ncbi:MAG: CDP-diacylglycerol--glycerol-3-phosphate 3-phosphatidyltransferase [Bacilli bacterium]|nr:CDP-diacylglycerol--glycerol-3-phosphate 3-phosphatidyltransferase [Bacilli bacterium]MBR1818331.1 CDP-diacylglycerol--glycerol-3-phosphate 3-phosphatidyltransferase [Bacilli bacterium]